MPKYRLTWEHPKKTGDVLIEGDVVDCMVYLMREGLTLKDIREVKITKVFSSLYPAIKVKKGTMFDGSVVERPT